MELYYEKIGDEGLPPLIIFHGFLGSLDNWKSYAKRFTNYFQVYLIDLRNHGKSPHVPGFNYSLMSEDVKLFIQKKSLENITLLGHSMGGKVAIQVARDMPDNVNSLMVIDISPKEYQVIESKKIVDIINQIDLTSFTSRFQVSDYLKTKLKNPMMINFLVKNIEGSPDGLRWKFNLSALVENLTSLKEGVTITKPIEVKSLFVRGEKSNYLLEEDEIFIQQKFNQVQITTIPDAGHWVHYEKKEELWQVLKKFLIL